MAGIGFELRRLVEGDSVLQKIKGYAAAGMISSGPWIMTIVTLAVLSVFGPELIGQSDYELFRSIITYAFAYSLIVVGVAQMAVTRRVADDLYSHRYDRILPTFTSTCTALGALQIVIGSFFCWVAGLPIALAIVSVSLYVVISLTWIALIWLSAVKDFAQILRSYLMGALVSLTGTLFAATSIDLVGLLAMYTAGQALTLAMMVFQIGRELHHGDQRDWSAWRCLVRYKNLVVVGLLSNAALWIDKVVFWVVDGSGPNRFFRFHPLYDTACFLAYLTVIPALAVNLVRVETNFYERYRAYFGGIIGGMPYKVILERKGQMLRMLFEGVQGLLRTQGAITFLAIVFAPWILKPLDVPDVTTMIFRAACLASLFHVLLLIVLLIQMYFDFQREAALTTLVFFLTNFAGALWSVEAGVWSYGIGYALSSLVTLLVGYGLLKRGLDQLEYLTFTSQPIIERPS
ncbi:MAG: exopolysaccharide Pel transporter PelG [Planctomycetes bacterium]|nr:exopolysaccharide Pel transporter PelG [Planctomycetota bacterium]